MSNRQENPITVDKEFEREIVSYLRDNPDFFERHLDLLADMLLPHQPQGAVSLIERQVSVLRDQKQELKQRLQQLTEYARQNEDLSSRLNKLILDLLDADDFETLLTLIQQRLKSDFEADAVVIRLFNSGAPVLKAHPDLMDWSEPALGAFEKVINGRKPVCGSLKPGQLDALFNDYADVVRSAALIPLVESESSKQCVGLLAIGSQDPQRFRANMGTLFLSHLSHVLTRILKLHLGS
ncbi:MAG: DUF484 family protein [Thiohalophilus sp.]|uniref:DUF484 family protein n=1 Tax=Thiohalophilus sp. TaxID=3028392 RepID=UPI00286FC7B6|nr:DUF484 family protein [Thiohalophilus sp.]MDR9437847.1 DUF484 family protein [Thiohalophilus sp.]